MMMNKAVLGAMAVVLTMGIANAEDWTGEIATFSAIYPNTNTVGGAPEYTPYSWNSYQYIPSSCYSDTGPITPPPCSAGQKVSYRYGPRLNLQTIPANALIGPLVEGAYIDPTTNAVSYFGTRISLNEFATSSSVSAIRNSLSALGTRLNAITSDLAGFQSSLNKLSQQIKAIQSQTRISNSGVAQALAMAGTTDIQPDEHFAVSINVGTFRGQTAVASAAVARLTQHVSFNAGVTSGVNGGPMGARAGIRFGW
jgi:hypothetical protein